MADACKGYSYNTPDGMEYDCDYEYSGGITCDDCIFGCCGGTQDPRIKPNPGKCEICGDYYDEEDLQMHDGQYMCSDCWDSK